MFMFLCVWLSSLQPAQSPPTASAPPLRRHVEGQTIISKELDFHVPSFCLRSCWSRGLSQDCCNGDARPSRGFVCSHYSALGKRNASACVEAGRDRSLETLLATSLDGVYTRRSAASAGSGEAGSDTHCHARRPLSRTTLNASPYSTNRLSTVVTEASGSLWRSKTAGSRC